MQGFAYRNASNPIGLFCMIGDTNVDFVKHHYHPLIDEPFVNDGIRMFTPKEIMAMKVAAILKRGVKKDFLDLAELFQHFTVKECISAYKEKYSTQNY